MRSLSPWQVLDISLDFVVDAARRRLATLTPEVAGYVVLLAARELELRPRAVSARTLALAEGGEVRVRAAEPASREDVESALRGVLASLVALAPSPAPAISAVAQRSDRIGLSAFASELAAALIPINHAAAQRALARLYRESQRARQSGPASEGVTHEGGDADEPSARLHRTPRPLAAAAAPAAGVERTPIVTGEVIAPERHPEPELLDIDVELEPDAPARLAAPPDPSTPLVPAAASGDTTAERSLDLREASAPEPSANEASLAAPVAPEPFASAPAEVGTAPGAPAPSDDEPEQNRCLPEPFAREPSAPEPLESTPEPLESTPEPLESTPEPLESAPEPFALGPRDGTREPFALAPRDVMREPFAVAPREPFALAPTSDRATTDPDEPVTGAIDLPTPPAVLVPMPIIGLREREREAVVPMAIIEGSAATALDAEPPAIEAAPGDAQGPRLLEPLETIDGLARHGFARLSWPSLPPANEDLSIEDRRSDVQQLLQAFLSEQRSEERMTRGLRRMLGLEPGSTDAARAARR